MLVALNFAIFIVIVDQVLELVVQAKVNIPLVGDLAREDIEHLHHEENLIDEGKVNAFIRWNCVVLPGFNSEKALFVPCFWAC